MRHHCWERTQSDSVGTSGRKGGGYTVAFASRTGTGSCAVEMGCGARGESLDSKGAEDGGKETQRQETINGEGKELSWSVRDLIQGLCPHKY